MVEACKCLSFIQAFSYTIKDIRQLDYESNIFPFFPDAATLSCFFFRAPQFCLSEYEMFSSLLYFLLRLK
jgi:hypothetical protein